MESPEEALYRELEEEVGLKARQVEIVGATRGWLRYKLPRRFLRTNNSSFVGQKQKWFLLGLEADDARVELNNSSEPEFDDWRWVSYWYPVNQVIEFKRGVYRRALKELLNPLNDYVEKK